MLCDEDAQCGIDNFCWYASKEDRIEKTEYGVGIKKCMPMYSAK